jgi:hypothetical protein
MSFLEDLFESAKKKIFRKDVERLTESYQHLLGVLEVFPRTGASEAREDKLFESMAQFGEWDSQLADLIVRRMANQDYRKISLDDETRMMIVNESRRLYVWDVTTQYMIELWTDYGYGQKPDIVPRSERLKEIWDEFWNSQENQYVFNEREINQLSNKLQVDGEYWFVQFISKLDGESSMRIIETDDIVKIYYEQEDKTVPVYYRREWWSDDYGSTYNKLYYRDYRASDEQAEAVRKIVLEDDQDAKFAEDQLEKTDVVVLHVKYRDINGRGWPFLTAGFAWSRGYKGFLEDRATINKAAAAVVEKVKVQGGQRMVDAVKQRLQSSLVGASNRIETNPPPASGSIWVENQALDREWMSRPTNAADAEKDGIAILSQVALAGKIYPHYLGRGEYYRLATATAMEVPTFRSFNRYQSFWSSVWRTLVLMVANAKVKYGGESFDTLGIDVTPEIDVNTDRIIDTSINELDEMMDAVSKGVQAGTISNELAQKTQLAMIRMALQTLGIPNVAELTDVEIIPDEEVPDEEIPDEEQPDVEEMAEAIETGGYMGYQQAIHSAIYGMWSGALDYFSFVDMLQNVIDIGLRRAWRDGMLEVGLNWEDRTMEEEMALSNMIIEQWGYVPGLADWLEKNNKASGQLFRDTLYREEMWVNAYQQAYNRALQMAQSDPKLKWILGATEQHCKDCSKYDGKVKRSSYWQKIGASPQSPDLECKGINCDCRLEPTDEPLSRGYLTPPTGE